MPSRLRTTAADFSASGRARRRWMTEHRIPRDWSTRMRDTRCHGTLTVENLLDVRDKQQGGGGRCAGRPLPVVPYGVVWLLSMEMLECSMSQTLVTSW